MNQKLISQTKDFRQYEPEWVSTGNGSEILMQLCEEKIEGRWEPFYATLASRKA